MDENRRIILYLTKKRIKITDVTLGEEQKEDVISDFEWTPEKVLNSLSKDKDNIKQPIRILISDDFVYTLSISEISGTLYRDDVKAKVQAIIPEIIDETIWDYQEFSDLKKIQVVVMVKSKFESLKLAFDRLGIYVELIEPVSFNLARSSQAEEKPICYLFIEDKDSFFVLTLKGAVLATEKIRDLSQDAILRFINFTKDKFGTQVNEVIFCGDTSKVDLSKYENDNYKPQIQFVNPTISLAKRDLIAAGSNMLNLKLQKPLPPPIGPATQPMSTHEKKTNKWIVVLSIIVFIMLIAVLIAIFMFEPQIRQDQSMQKTIQSESSTSVEDVITQPPLSGSNSVSTPSAEIDISEFAISILNGSGISGEAASLEAVLQEEDFNIVEIGNADQNVNITTISYKELVPEIIISQIQSILEERYEVLLDPDLDGEAAEDIQIIIGSDEN